MGVAGALGADGVSTSARSRSRAPGELKAPHGGSFRYDEMTGRRLAGRARH